MVRKCRSGWHKTPGNLLFLQISQPNILKQLINTCWCRNVPSFRRQQKVQIVFKKDTQALFFFFFLRRISNICWHPQAERQIFFQFKKHMLLSLSKKKPKQKHPSSKAIEEGLFANFTQFSCKKKISKITPMQYLVLRAVDNRPQLQSWAIYNRNLKYALFASLHLVL